MSAAIPESTVVAWSTCCVKVCGVATLALTPFLAGIGAEEGKNGEVDTGGIPMPISDGGDPVMVGLLLVLCAHL